MGRRHLLRLRFTPTGQPAGWQSLCGRLHSDRSSQYGSREYRQLLEQAGIRQSISARANPYHNAWTESFIGTLKTEMLQDGCFIDGADARIELFPCI